MWRNIAYQVDREYANKFVNHYRSAIHRGIPQNRARDAAKNAIEEVGIQNPIFAQSVLNAFALQCNIEFGIQIPKK